MAQARLASTTRRTECSVMYYVQRVLIKELKATTTNKSLSLIEIVNMCQFFENPEKNQYLAAVLFIVEEYILDNEQLEITNRIRREVRRAANERFREYVRSIVTETLNRNELAPFERIVRVIFTLAQILRWVHERESYGSLGNFICRMDAVLRETIVSEYGNLEMWMRTECRWADVLLKARNVQAELRNSEDMDEMAISEDGYSTDSGEIREPGRRYRCKLTYHLIRMVLRRLDKKPNDDPFKREVTELKQMTENPSKQEEVETFKVVYHKANCNTKTLLRRSVIRDLNRTNTPVALNRQLYNYIGHKMNLISANGRLSWKTMMNITYMLAVMVPKLYSMMQRSAMDIFNFVDKTLDRYRINRSSTISTWIRRRQRNLSRVLSEAIEELDRDTVISGSSESTDEEEIRGDYEVDRCGLTYFLKRKLLHRLKNRNDDTDPLLLEVTRICSDSERSALAQTLASFNFVYQNFNRGSREQKRLIGLELKGIQFYNRLSENLRRYIKIKIKDEIVMNNQWSWEKIMKIALFLSYLVKELYAVVGQPAEVIFTFIDRILSRYRFNTEFTMDEWVQAQGGWDNVRQVHRELAEQEQEAVGRNQQMDIGDGDADGQEVVLQEGGEEEEEEEEMGQAEAAPLRDEPMEMVNGNAHRESTGGDKCDLTYFLRRILLNRLQQRCDNADPLLLAVRTICSDSENRAMAGIFRSFLSIYRIFNRGQSGQQSGEVINNLNRIYHPSHWRTRVQGYIKSKIKDEIVMNNKLSWEKIMKITLFLSYLVRELYVLLHGEAAELFTYVDEELSKCRFRRDFTIDEWVQAQGGWEQLRQVEREMMDAEVDEEEEEMEEVDPAALSNEPLDVADRGAHRQANVPQAQQERIEQAQAGPSGIGAAAAGDGDAHGQAHQPSLFPPKNCKGCRVPLIPTHLKTQTCNNCGKKNCMAMGCFIASPFPSFHRCKHKNRDFFGSSIDPLEKCSCGRTKDPRPDQDILQCPTPGCNLYNCTFPPGCDYIGKTPRHVRKHIGKIHRQRIGEETICMGCPRGTETRKPRNSGAEFERCRSCRVLWCLRGRCPKECSSYENMKRHMLLAHRIFL